MAKPINYYYASQPPRLQVGERLDREQVSCQSQQLLWYPVRIARNTPFPVPAACSNVQQLGCNLLQQATYYYWLELPQLLVGSVLGRDLVGCQSQPESL